jgi:tRNA threonylcarbamoyladenosine biosynthesis protein TsaE
VRAELTVVSADHMRELGRRLAATLRAGDLVVLNGPLGAGKTTLAQGIGAGLAVRGPVTSPTFVIARVHPSLAGGPALVHADAYRLASPAEVDDLDLDASLETSVTVVEWGGGLVEDLAAERLEITIGLAASGTSPDADAARAQEAGTSPAAAVGQAAAPGTGPDGAVGPVGAVGAAAGDGAPGLDQQPRRVLLEGHGERWESADDSARLALHDGP